MCWKNDDGATEYALPGVCCEPVIIGSDDLRGSKRHMTDPLCGAYWGGHENKARDRLWCPMALWLYIAIFFFAVGATVWVFGVAPCAGDGAWRRALGVAVHVHDKDRDITKLVLLVCY